jgi:hypothetical protein
VRTEKAGVGGSTPSLATIILKDLFELLGAASVRSQSALRKLAESRFHSLMMMNNLGACDSSSVRFQSAFLRDGDRKV